MTDQPQPPCDRATGRPRPFRHQVGRFTGSLVIVTLATGALLVAAEALTTPTLGATRSRRIRWQDRQAEIDAATSDAAVIPSQAKESP